MKVLKTCLMLSLLYSFTIADDNLDKFLSNYKIEQFNYDYKKNESQSLQLRDSWISPVNLSYSYMKSDANNVDVVSKTTSINLDQPIFRSGGIYSGIKYAKASKNYINDSIDISKQKMIKDSLALLIQIKQIDLKIKKQKLRIKNAKINLAIKKEQYLNGQLDSGFLDNAIIEQNTIISALYDIQTSKERLISTFQAISDIDYKNIELPIINFIEKDDFIKNNLLVKMAKNNNLKSDYYKDMSIAKYLPSVHLVAGYNWNKSEVNSIDTKDDYYNYGLKITMPLNINTFRDIESSKIESLKSEVDIKDKKRQLNALYDQVMQNISNIKKKINLSKDNKIIYMKLLEDTKKLYKAGYKTEYDVELLSNSFKMQDLDIKILLLDNDLELLNLYESYKK